MQVHPSVAQRMAALPDYRLPSAEPPLLITMPDSRSVGITVVLPSEEHSRSSHDHAKEVPPPK